MILQVDTLDPTAAALCRSEALNVDQVLLTSL